MSEPKKETMEIPFLDFDGNFQGRAEKDHIVFFIPVGYDVPSSYQALLERPVDPLTGRPAPVVHYQDFIYDGTNKEELEAAMRQGTAIMKLAERMVEQYVDREHLKGLLGEQKRGEE